MPDKTNRNPRIFQAHDNYYAWRNLQPATGDVVVNEHERRVVAVYVSQLENAVRDMSTDTEMGPWPWDTIDREVD